MPIFKAVNKHYWSERDFENLIHYAVDKNGSVNLFGARAVLCGKPEDMFRQMMDVKRYFHKEKNRMACHYILSFSKEEAGYITSQEALWTGYRMMEECFPRHQAVFGVHGDTDDLHIHFAVNCTSYEDGKAFEMSPSRLGEMKHYAEFLVWSCRLRSLPEEERKELVFQQAGRMGGSVNKE